MRSCCLLANMQNQEKHLWAASIIPRVWKHAFIISSFLFMLLKLFILSNQHFPDSPAASLTRESIKMQKIATAVFGKKVESSWGEGAADRKSLSDSSLHVRRITHWERRWWKICPMNNTGLFIKTDKTSRRTHPFYRITNYLIISHKNCM